MRIRRDEGNPAELLGEHRSVQSKLDPLLDKEEQTERDKERIEKLKEERKKLETEIKDKLGWDEEEVEEMRSEGGQD